jgi:hypothetical protein
LRYNRLFLEFPTRHSPDLVAILITTGTTKSYFF